MRPLSTLTLIVAAFPAGCALNPLCFAPACNEYPLAIASASMTPENPTDKRALGQNWYWPGGHRWFKMMSFRVGDKLGFGIQTQRHESLEK
jgi:hypothetical protein